MDKLDIILESLIQNGDITQQEFDNLVEKLKSDPNSPTSKLKNAEDNIEQLSEESLFNMLAIAEAYEKSQLDTLAREEESSNAMVGLAEVYEALLILQMRVEELENK
jgi:hypothetical protein